MIADYKGNTYECELSASQNAAAHRIAFKQMKGGFSSELKGMRGELLELVSLMAVDINNNPDIGTWLQNNNIAHPVNTEINSGFISYPVYDPNNDFKDELEYDD